MSWNSDITYLSITALQAGLTLADIFSHYDPFGQTYFLNNVLTFFDFGPGVHVRP